MRRAGRVLTLYGRELKAYFYSPIAYVVAGIFLFLNGFLFGAQLQTRLLSMEELFWRLAAVLLFVAPMVSMRLLSEELRSGTYETLATDPVDAWDIVTGKYLGALTFTALLLLPLAAFAGFCHALAAGQGGLDLGPVAAGFTGLLLQIATSLSLGLLMSALTGNQIVAGVATFVVLLVLHTLFRAGDLVRSDFLREATSYLGTSGHLYRFFRGQIALEDVVYFVKTALFALFLAVLVLDWRRWR